MESRHARRLTADGPLGCTWAMFLAFHATELAQECDPWLIHDLVDGKPVGLPWPDGPAVYAVFGDGGWRHVGQTRTRVDQRLRSHFRGLDPLTRRIKLARWQGVVIAQVPPVTPARQVDAIERAAGQLLRPSGGGTGGRYPRLRL